MIRYCISLLVFSMLLGGVNPANSASPWPTQPVRIIVPTPAGSSVDVVARIVAEKLGTALGQTVLVDNKAGAGGTIGVDAAVKARDGHTLLLGYNGPLTVAPSLFPRLPYKPLQDLRPIILAVTQPNVLAVRSDLKVSTVRELVDLAKSTPGKIDYASVGNGSLSHLAMEMLKIQTGSYLLHIPFNGGPAAALALGRGDVQVLFAALSNVQSLVKSGQVRLLAVSNAKRSIAVPELPTVAESGLSGFDATTWNGFLAPATLPAEVIQRLNKEIGLILAMPDVRQRLLVAGAEVSGGSPEQFAALLKTEAALWSGVIERSGIKPD